MFRCGYEIDYLDLSVRVYNVLLYAGIKTISDLKNLDDEELGKIRNLGSKGIAEIRDKLNKCTMAERPIDAKALKNRFEYERICQGDYVMLRFDKAFELINAAPTIETKSEWISTKDKLPEDNDRVLCFSPSLAKSDVGGIAIQWGWCCKKRNTDITHWKSLPTPPKGE